MKIFSSVLLVSSLLAAGSSVAQTCRDLDDNSCWQFHNRSAESVRISCGSGRADNVLSGFTLAAFASSSYQFDRSSADGLGSFDPNQPLSCTIVRPEAAPAVLNFSTISIGDRISLEAFDDFARVTVREYWGARVQVYETDRSSTSDAE